MRDLQHWLKSRYAAHAHPRNVHFVESLPKTAIGKVQRFVLRQSRRKELAALKDRADG
ncbi:AMP-binding enzyme [Mesorhizobium sp. f-mel]